MSGDILKLIAAETYGESYRAHKIELDVETDSASRIDNRESNFQNPKLGETIKYKSYRAIKNSDYSPPVLTYFLDGSRHVYKIDEISYQHGNARKVVYPIVAGQVAVGCCRRKNKKMFAEKIFTEIVLALPDVANFDGQKGFFPDLTHKINEVLADKKFKVKVGKILEYSTSQGVKRADEFSDRAVAEIQYHMYHAEQTMVADLVSQNKLNQKNYLVKDGSLEYNLPPKDFDVKKILRFKNNFNYVIGVSKKFNPARWTDANNRPNPGFIAELPLYHRTPVLCYENSALHGDIKFAVWYLRIRSRHTDSPFDGIVKIEKMLVTQEETETEKIDSDLVNKKRGARTRPVRANRWMRFQRTCFFLLLFLCAKEKVN